MRELLFKKGYHLEVTSWENDADNYNTKMVYIGEDEKIARSLLKLCKELFESYHHGKNMGIGNMGEDEEKAAGIKMQNYLKNNPESLLALNSICDEPIDITKIGSIRYINRFI